jgi:hypothetical protein
MSVMVSPLSLSHRIILSPLVVAAARLAQVQHKQHEIASRGLTGRLTFPRERQAAGG